MITALLPAFDQFTVRQQPDMMGTSRLGKPGKALYIPATYFSLSRNFLQNRQTAGIGYGIHRFFNKFTFTFNRIHAYLCFRFKEIVFWSIQQTFIQIFQYIFNAYTKFIFPVPCRDH